MARAIEIGDVVAITAAVRKRIENRVTLLVPTATHPYSIVDPKAKPGDQIKYEGEVIFVDEDTGRVTVRMLGSVTVDMDTVVLVKAYRPPSQLRALRDKPD